MSPLATPGAGGQRSVKKVNGSTRTHSKEFGKWRLFLRRGVPEPEKTPMEVRKEKLAGNW